MNTTYSPELRGLLFVDEQRRPRQILHTGGLVPSEKASARQAAHDYLLRMAETLQIPREQLVNLHQRVSFFDPREQETEYRLSEVKKQFASATFCYEQTVHNVPVWRGGVSVTVKENPYRIVRAVSHAHAGVLELPPREAIARVREALLALERQRGGRLATAPEGVAFASLFAPAAGPAKNEAAAWTGHARVTRGAFYIYRYEAARRLSRLAGRGARTVDLEVSDHRPTLPLAPVPGHIHEGAHHLVAEVIFNLRGGAGRGTNWRALVEVESGAILFLRAMIAGVSGQVFVYDPKTSTGNLALTPDTAEAVLNGLRQPVELPDLDVAMMGTQALAGAHVTIADDDIPAVAPPTRPEGTDFDYPARSNDFAAVNAYYHANNVFRTIEELGFDLSTYFDGTSFPVHVDHRASNNDALLGIEVNAYCDGDAEGDGIGVVGYCLSDDTGDDDVNVHPLGRSVDRWVHWHELGGHGILWDHLNDWSFGDDRVHSAGDAMAAFQNDPESKLRDKPERFQYAPFRDWPVGADRWFNRAVADGWGWGGPNDGGGYLSEQVLATTLFRVYRSLGGDSEHLARRRHASRVATWLVLNGVGHLSPGTNPDTPEELYGMLAAADADDWTSEGLAGGAYGKVIRWSFEKQGLWAGAPPAVDLYIDDGRGGEYTYQPVHWHNPSVWNRKVADGLTGAQPGKAGVPSFAYVKVKNRGGSDAGGMVRLYHCKPGAGLTWPTDFVQVGPADGIPTGNVKAHDGNEVTVGPFQWTPNENSYGHDCLLAIVSTEQDPSNVASLEPGQTIAEWRLVPHDNNIGQRNVPLVPGAGGGESLMAGLNGAVFFVGNNFNRPATMELRIREPRLLAERGWRLEAGGGSAKRFTLRPGEKRQVQLGLAAGRPFDARELERVEDRDYVVEVFGNGMVVGGMTYRVDPRLDASAAAPRPETHRRRDGWLMALLRRILGWITGSHR